MTGHKTREREPYIISHKEYAKLKQIAKRITKSWGRTDLMEDFLHDLCVHRTEGNVTQKIDLFAIDWLRKYRGSSRSEAGRRRQETMHLETLPTPHELQKAVESPSVQQVYKDYGHIFDYDCRDHMIFVMFFLLEYKEHQIAWILGFSESRCCQILNSVIKPRVRKYLEDNDLV